MEIKVTQNVTDTPCEVLVISKFQGEKTSLDFVN